MIIEEGYLLKEDRDNLLLESGDKILLDFLPIAERGLAKAKSISYPSGKDLPYQKGKEVSYPSAKDLPYQKGKEVSYPSGKEVY